jgi:hypothetical protein
VKKEAEAVETEKKEGGRSEVGSRNAEKKEGGKVRG